MSTMWTYDIVSYVGGSDIGHNVDEKNIDIVSYVGPSNIVHDVVGPDCRHCRYVFHKKFVNPTGCASYCSEICL